MILKIFIAWLGFKGWRVTGPWKTKLSGVYTHRCVAYVEKSKITIDSYSRIGTLKGLFRARKLLNETKTPLFENPNQYSNEYRLTLEATK